jgi:acyl-CoA thioester hydrolase
MSEFIWPVRVYYEDTDSGGVVYYANYLRFMERARTEYLRHFGFEQDQLIADEGVIFAVRSIEVDYRRPARFNELLEVSASISQRGGASITFHQEIRRNGEVLCSGKVKIASLEAGTMRPVPIPKQIVSAMDTSEK